MSEINTGGGTNIAGDVDTGGGNLVGRDRVQTGTVIVNNAPQKNLQIPRTERRKVSNSSDTGLISRLMAELENVTNALNELRKEMGLLNNKLTETNSANKAEIGLINYRMDRIEKSSHSIETLSVNDIRIVIILLCVIVAGIFLLAWILGNGGV